jgi:hypothetical protein
MHYARVRVDQGEGVGRATSSGLYSIADEKYQYFNIYDVTNKSK